MKIDKNIFKINHEKSIDVEILENFVLLEILLGFGTKLFIKFTLTWWKFIGSNCLLNTHGKDLCS